ncbi:transposase [Phormidium sp. CLA17]|uniref:transposase n=1 Tax=Leptolyngbya sp. Cla-17 TaxID=2803751 RepID=UPI0014910BA0|nr:transposase [Leptolyngbya sp. Cla-17]MBM0744459.1 transposase [Leptolyngbya sp. Cla-17]
MNINTRELCELTLVLSLPSVAIPSYSPDFNPIEQFWSKVKAILRAIAPRTKQALDEAMTQAFAQVSLKDIRHWFTHCCYCTSLD